MTIYEHLYSEFKEGRLALFYEKMYPELLAYAIRLLGDEHAFLSEDCVQDSIFKAYRQRHTFTSSLQWKLFLYTCIHNEAVSIFRKGQSQKNYLCLQDERHEDMAELFIEQETLTLLYEAIEALPEKYKALFDLSFEQGLKNAEVAKRLRIAEISVKKQKKRLIELLRDSLKNKMDEECFCLLVGLLSAGIAAKEPDASLMPPMQETSSSVFPADMMQTRK